MKGNFTRLFLVGILLSVWGRPVEAGTSDEDLLRVHKCSALLDESASSSFEALPQHLRKHFVSHMLSLTSVVTGEIQFLIPNQYDVTQESVQNFQMIGSLQQKRAVAHSVEGSALQYFITTQQGGFGWAEFRGSGPSGDWQLLYLLICS